MRRVAHLVCLLAVLGAPVVGLPAPAGAEGAVNRVTIGVYINDIQQVDLESNSFTADLYLWLRWRNPEIDPSATIEVMNSDASANTTSSSTGGLKGEPLYPAPVDMPDGSKYMVLRFQGMFATKTDLEIFPFDLQKLNMVFEDSDMGLPRLEYVPDDPPVVISDTVTIQGYEVDNPTMTIVEHKYPTGFGDLTAPAEVKYSRVVVTVPVHRDVPPYLVKIILPIAIVILITSLIFVLPARLEEARAGIGVTAMLTLVALQWATDSDLPSTEYLMMLDTIYILSLIYVLIAMVYTVLASRRTNQQEAEAVLSSLDRRVGVITLLGYVVTMVVTILLYVR